MICVADQVVLPRRPRMGHPSSSQLTARLRQNLEPGSRNMGRVNLPRLARPRAPSSRPNSGTSTQVMFLQKDSPLGHWRVQQRSSSKAHKLHLCHLHSLAQKHDHHSLRKAGRVCFRNFPFFEDVRVEFIRAVGSKYDVSTLPSNTLPSSKPLPTLPSRTPR